MQTQDVTRVLSDPLAQELMQSSIPARLAYLGLDGFPRAIPIGFHWNGVQFVLCTVPHAPKVSALKTNPKVAFTVDTNAFPPHVLLVRGTAVIDIVDGVPPEYLAASRKGVGPLKAASKNARSRPPERSEPLRQARGGSGRRCACYSPLLAMRPNKSRGLGRLDSPPRATTTLSPAPSWWSVLHALARTPPAPRSQMGRQHAR